MKIYTKTGDKGKTSLFGGKRVSKGNCMIDICGEIDELNSVIGVAIAKVSSIIHSASSGQEHQVSSIRRELINVQRDLFGIGAILAGSKRSNLEQGSTLKRRVGELEELIDQMEKELPKLKNFILPGGGGLGSALHLVRAVCRRAERRMVQLSAKEKIDGDILVYLNRLSDLLFVMARFANFKEKKKEIVWPK